MQEMFAIVNACIIRARYSLGTDMRIFFQKKKEGLFYHGNEVVKSWGVGRGGEETRSRVLKTDHNERRAASCSHVRFESIYAIRCGTNVTSTKRVQ